ncbi:MAG: 2-dehydropantoate 2-reductase [Victivallaceae bacterium]|nr:2-dehydropantoate 2-reductase [Victivallaceae bacterium]
MENNRVLIIGAGGIGAYFGGRLAQAGMEVAVVCRSNYTPVKKNGFDIRSIAGDFSFNPAGVYRSCAEYPGAADYLIVTTKVLPEIEAVKIIAAAVKPGTAIVLIQNGIGIETDIAAAYPDHELISAVAYIGVFRESDNRIEHQAAGHLKMGLYRGGSSAKLDLLCRAFNRAGVECEAVADIEFCRWVKLVWNTPYNPVSVLAGGADTRVISTTPELDDLCMELMREVCAVAAARGIHLPADIIRKNLDYTRAFPPYKTSMLLDFEHKRPLEAEAIVGKVVQLARAARVAVPRLETVYALLTAADISNRSRS